VSDQSATAVRTCRLMYYGPRGSGKRENLQRIIASIPPENRIANAGEDPTTHMAFCLPNQQWGDWKVSFQVVDTGAESYSPVPGRSSFPFDGVVFVTHSSASRLDQNLSALEALKTYLDTWGRDVTSVPLVIQYNKREKENCLPVDRLESLLNPWGLLSFPASSSQGEGIKETLKAILSLAISKLLQGGDKSDLGLDEGSGAGGRCLMNEAEKRVERQDPVAEPSFCLTPDRPDLQIVTEPRGGLFFEDLRPPIVVPVRIPRHLLEKFSSARIILEIEIDEGNPILS
jgi:hypothetical protein